MAKGLSKPIIEAKKGKVIQVVWVGGNEHITHLLFVDDALIFYNEKMVEGRNMHEIHQLLCNSTCVEVYYLNSIIYFNDLFDINVFYLKTLFLYINLLLQDILKY